MDYALKDIRILDLSRVWAGPLAGRILADLGAQVLNIVGRVTMSITDITPEMARIMGVFPNDDPGERPWIRASLPNDLGRNKLGFTLELNTDEGIEVFKKLVKVSDVVLENYSPRVMPNFGLDYDNLAKINPDIIMCSMPGYGASGPYRDWVTFGTNLDPASGLASLMGYPGQGPHMSGNAYPDPVAAAHAVSAILTALIYRDRTGKGQNIDLAQAESASFLIGEAALGYSLNDEIPERIANRHPVHAPWGCYPCLGDDKWLTISICSDEEWQSFCRAMESSDLLYDQRFSSEPGRYQHHDLLDEIITAWTKTKDHYAAMHFLQSHGVAAAAVLDAPELLSDPHLNQRNFFVDVDHPETGPLPHTTLPIRFSDTPPPPNGRASTLGEHNDYVLKEILDLSDEEVSELKAKNIVGTDPMS